METQYKMDFYDDYVIYSDGKSRIRLETYVRNSKIVIFELVIAIPEKLYLIDSSTPISAEERIVVVRNIKTYINQTPDKTLTFDEVKLMLNKDDFASKTHAHNEPRSFKGFHLLEDNSTAFNSVLDVEVKLEVGLSGSEIIYREKEKSLTLQAGADIIGEVIYSNTVYLESPLTWDPPNSSESISEAKVKEIKTNIISAMELFNSLVFFREVKKQTKKEREDFVFKQIEIIKKRKEEKLSKSSDSEM